MTCRSISATALVTLLLRDLNSSDLINCEGGSLVKGASLLVVVLVVVTLVVVVGGIESDCDGTHGPLSLLQGEL